MPLMMCCNSDDYADPVFEEKRRILFLKTPKSFYENVETFFKKPEAFFQNQKRSSARRSFSGVSDFSCFSLAPQYLQ